MYEFAYKEIKQEGLETLESVANADKFNQWMYQTIQPFCQGRILEIGSGIGNISQFFLEDKADLTVSDIRTNYCQILHSKFSHFPNLNEVIQLNLVEDDFDTKYIDLFGTFDTIFALNVIEHIKEDTRAIQNCRKLLKPGGTLIILVPAYQWLYNNFDENLEHYRRYTAKTLYQSSGNSWKLVKQQYFNALGMAGWIVSGKLMKNAIIPSSQMKFYNVIVPIAKLLDLVLMRQTGLSVIQVLNKNVH
jgi:SAM-dependent methyltransferase